MTVIQPIHALGRLKIKLAKTIGDDMAAYLIGFANLLPESDSFVDAAGQAWENINQIVSKDGSTGFSTSQVVAITKPNERLMQLAVLLESKDSSSGYTTRFIEQDFSEAADQLSAMAVEFIEETDAVVLPVDENFEAFNLRWLNQEQSIPRMMQRAFDAGSEYRFQNIKEVLECMGEYGSDITDIALVAQAPFSPDQHSLLLISVPDQQYPETYILYSSYDAVMQELSGQPIEMVELPAEREGSNDAAFRLSASRHYLGERLLKALRPDVGLQAPRFPDNIF